MTYYIEAIANFFASTLSWILLRFWYVKKVEIPSKTGALGVQMKQTRLLTNLGISFSERNIAPTGVQSPLYFRLLRILSEKDETIDVLNRRLAFLSGEIKLKDLRIANLVAQISNFDLVIGLQRTRPYVTGSNQPRIKSKTPSNFLSNV